MSYCFSKNTLKLRWLATLGGCPTAVLSALCGEGAGSHASTPMPMMKQEVKTELRSRSYKTRPHQLVKIDVKSTGMADIGRQTLVVMACCGMLWHVVSLTLRLW